MEALDVLKGAYHLLDDPKRWTANAPARDADGKALNNANDPRAVAWCASGAMWRTRGGPGIDDWEGSIGEWEPWHLLADACNPDRHPNDLLPIVTTNNGENGYELIREAFRKAIVDATPVEERQETERELALV